jgi:hypothetical protein
MEQQEKQESIEGPIREDPKVILAFCTKGDIKPSVYFDTLRLVASGLIQGVLASCGTILPQTRNTAIANALDQDRDLTHILFIDDDVAGITPEIVKAMIDADKDIISPVTNSRNAPFRPHLRVHDIPKLVKELEKDQDDRDILEVDGIGMGCALIRAEVFEAVAEIGSDKKHLTWFTFDREPRDEFWGEVDAALSQLDSESDSKDALKEGVKMGLSAHIGSMFIGEDFAFCTKARNAGFKVWVHCQYYLGHVGEVVIDIGDWLEYLERHPVGHRIEQKVCIWKGADG